MTLNWDIIFVGLALSADSFSAALAMGFKSHKLKDSLKFAFSSGSAEGLVALLGAFAGAKIIARIAAFDHWIAFGLLAAVAGHMFKEGVDELKNGQEENSSPGFHSFKKILLVSFATSLDALGVGVGLGVAGRELPPYIISIALWAFIATLAGMFLAKRIPRALGPFFNFFGAGILFVLAFQMLEI